MRGGRAGERFDQLAGLREWVRSSLWVLPAVFVLVSVALAIALPALDRRVEGVGEVRFVFGGSAQAGRSILSVIAGSMVSLVALVFSILIVVFQLTSSQFTPRALRTFLQDRASKIALGVFLATFAYSLTVMRAIREKDGNVLEFVPRLSITAAFVLALVSMGVFVYYIHHVSISIKLSSILARIHSEAADAIERLLPGERAGGRDDEGRRGLRSADDPARLRQPSRLILSRRAGYITSVRADQLLREAVKADAVIAVNRTVGTFVALGRPLLEIRPQDRDVDEGRLAGMVHLGDERTMEQDLGFGFRQLADIAVRALSPGVNDPTTASMAVDRIQDLLLRVGRRTLVDDCRADERGTTRVWVPRQSWELLVHEALHELVHYGKNSPQVTASLRSLVSELRAGLPAERMWVVDHELEPLDVSSGSSVQ